MKINHLHIAIFTATTIAVFIPTVSSSIAGENYKFINDAAAWQGFYLGSQVGWTKSHGKDSTSSTKLGANQGVAGFFGGYNWRKDNIVYGIELDANLLALQSGKKSKGAFSESFFTPFSSVRGRVGHVFGDSLLYGTAGLSLGVGVHKIAGDLEAKLHTGFVVGAGLEHAFNEKWHLRGEYLYHSFGKGKYKFNSGTRSLGFDDAHSLRIGVSYHF